MPPKPHATAVTRISRDHRQFFGDVLTDIAGVRPDVLSAMILPTIHFKP
jgi:hypothetical protein